MELVRLLFWWVAAVKRFIVTDQEDEASYCLFMMTVFPLLSVGVWIGLPLIQSGDGSPLAVILALATYVLGGLVYFSEQQLARVLRARASHNLPE